MEEDENGIPHDDGDTNVRVAVRCRPLNEREKAMPDMAKCVVINPPQLIITGPTGEEHSFAFDCVFDERSTQPQVWESVGLPILEKAFSGYNGTIFAYGQTGSGKTWSMQGADGDLEGVIPRMNNAVFERVASQKASNPNLQFLVTASYFELYNEIIFDLLDPTDRKKRSKSGLEIKEHPVLGVYVKGLQEIVVDNPTKMQHLLDQGMKSRTVASTQMNADSSRSHSVFTIKVHQKDSEDESKNLFAKVNLVDLAGSERVKSTGATGATLKEGANINKSLSALGNVINALVECAKGKKGVFVPYRNSKLTRVLQESLGGNSITVMIAALSPALCNFEETLSTLKYANRAKAIKVKAIKNDESSQISRLNEEIRMLKEKLMAQNSGGVASSHANVDTSLLEAKHQQQLRDLEEAMKSTWEEKARISAENEKDRIRLEREQQEAQRKLNQQREDNWRLLETKGDMDLSLTHLKDLLRIAQPEGGIERIGTWGTDLRDLSKFESELSEQFTVVEVYQTSLLRDSESLLKDKKTSNVMADKLVVGQWKQLREKFQASYSECFKWVQVYTKLMNCIKSFLVIISTSQSQWNESQSDNISSLEVSQVARGFALIHRQVQEKHQKYIQSSSKILGIVTGFQSIANRMEVILSTNLQKLDSLDSSNGGSSVDDAEREHAEEKRKILVDAVSAVNEMKSFFGPSGLLKQISSEGLTGNSPSPAMTHPSSPASSDLQETLVQFYENITCSNRTSVKKASVSGQESWVLSSSTSTGRDDADPYLQVSLSEALHLSTISVQGGVIPSGMHAINRSESSAISAMNHTKFLLPCGFGLDHCDGSIEHSVSFLADVISWETLIKKNPPEKFLNRPPVRFLFDLILYVVKASNLTVYTPDESSWDVVGSSKENKMAFIDKILSYVSNVLKIPPATNSGAVVSGAEAKLTNIFLQHLAIVAYCSQHSVSINSVLLPPPQLSPRALEKMDREIQRSREAWISKLRIGISSDGTNYHLSSPIETDLMGPNDTKKINLTSLFSPENLRTVKYIRLYPIEWEGSQTCLRFNLYNWKQTNHQADATPSSFESLLKGLVILKNTSDILSRALGYLNAAHDFEVAKKQEEVRKRMENLADEKLLLEQKLASEKLALNNEKQGLEEQLRVALSKLREAEELLAQEKSLSIQYETLHQQVLNENHSLQHSLQEQIEENNSLQSKLLLLQANNERDNVLMDGIRKRLEEESEKVNQLMVLNEQYLTSQRDWESEKEDLQNQIMILTEERDSARSNEEELYSVLKEKINDLERLQESYVDMTDRCNDYQDNMAELREEMENLKEVMLVESRQFIIASTSNPGLRGRTESENQREVVSESTQTPEGLDTKANKFSPRSDGDRDETQSQPKKMMTSASVDSIAKSTPSASLGNHSKGAIGSSNSPSSLSSAPASKSNDQSNKNAIANNSSKLEDDNYGDDNFEDDFEDDFES